MILIASIIYLNILCAPININVKNVFPMYVKVERQYEKYHCLKNVQIWNFFWSVFSCIWTEYRYLQSKYPHLI